jgi:hypothetical protein
MPYEEFVGWQEFYEIEPFGLAVLDAAQAHITSVLANVNRDEKKRAKPYTIDEFQLFAERGAPDVIALDDPDAQTEAMIAAQFGGLKVTRADKASQ